MKLPKVKNRKLIDLKEMEELAKKVKRSLEEEDRYIMEQRLKNGNNIFPRIYPRS